MPRANKTQPVEVPPGQPYGQRQAQEEMLQQQPMPDAQAEWEQTVGLAEATPAPPEGGLLNEPTQRPDEPLTAGMAMGAGPGPEALHMTQYKDNQVQRHLSRAAQLSGNPALARMAARAHKPIPRPLNRG